MPFIHDHKLVFIHIPKTGGTFVKKVLMGYDEKMCACKQKHITRHDHKTALHLQKRAPNTFKVFHSFAIVRNPYDRLVSEYYWGDYHKKMSFEKFIKGLPVLANSNSTVHLKSQNDFIYNKNKDKLMVDELLRFETYHQDLRKLFQKQNIKMSLLNNVKMVNTTAHKDWKSYFTPELYKIVNKVYSKDFELLGYEKLTE